MNALEHLLNDDLARLGLIVSTSGAMWVVLSRRKEVIELRTALQVGDISERAVESFVQRLMGDFTRGQKFPWDVALCGLAVAMETWPKKVAQQILESLANTNIIELPLAPHIARAVLNRRLISMTPTTIKTFKVNGALVNCIDARAVSRDRVRGNATWAPKRTIARGRVHGT